MKTIVFETDPTARAWLEAGLRARGHEVFGCASAGAAWELWRREQPALAILDWAGLEGSRLCRRIRDAEGAPCMIVAAGLTDRPADLQAALGAGADDYLPKTADAGTLAARLVVAERRALEVAERSRVERDLRRLEGEYKDAEEALRAALRREAEAHDAEPTADALTGVTDRVSFMVRLEEAVRRSQRRRDALFAVLVLDLDRFKLVNESLGRPAGDRLLAAVAQRLESCLRPWDTLGRFESDRFAILLDPVRDVADASRVAERIQKELAEPVGLEDEQILTSAGIGIALSAAGYDSAERMLRDAQSAMRRAKGGGCGRVSVHNESLRAGGLAELQLERELRRALPRGELRIHYQPILQLAPTRLLGFEALLHWQHPRRGLLPAAEFLRVAEALQLLAPMGHWVLHKACRQLRDWQERYPSVPPLSLSLNVSAQQLLEPDLVARLREALEDNALEAGSLRLELREAVAAGRSDVPASVLHGLRSLGLRLDVDDFGAAGSAAGSPQELSFDALKLDRSLVARMGSDEASAALVRTILALARSLRLPVVAQGVETDQQLAQLRALGCERGQGHYFLKPVDAAAVERVVAAQASGMVAESRRERPALIGPQAS
jgi:diguanylate cyclase (GGDEF)-like protein